MNTESIRQWLATDPRILQIVRDRSGVSDGEADEETAVWVEWAQNPKRWVRRSKMRVGSAAWQERFGYLLGDITSGVAREFWLRDTDHVTILLIEQSGSIAHIEDLSD